MTSTTDVLSPLARTAPATSWWGRTALLSMIPTPPLSSRPCGSMPFAPPSRMAAPLSSDATLCIQENLQRFIADDFVASELDRKALLDLLSPKAGASARLLEMAECGLLERMLPELSRFTAAPRRTRLAALPAAVHAVLPIRRLEMLRQSVEPGAGAVHRSAGGAALAGAADPRAAAARRRHPPRSRARPGESAHRAAGHRSASNSRRRRAETRAIPDSSPSADGAGGVPARCRQPGRPGALRHARRQRRAAQDAVPGHV